ncbi:hypothetical protein L1987_20724 [Smallanthus sonchifolius]|uniref:Uncharacterized protein n=1 Tax=Smallanthus sonchifolius TaxID=185202 RepID=A0ACB9IUF9_9ASTR|nr:hypothetical protein L1987_20724 [Smallanthus sonchifolius]
MAFECKVNTEIVLAKNSEVKSNPVVSSGKSLLIDSETVATNSGNSIHFAKLPIDVCLLNDHRTIADLPPALISEIFNCLGPKELGVVSCVSPSLYRIASDHHVWKEFYCERWGLPSAVPVSLNAECSDEKSWKALFVEREFRSKTFMGRSHTGNFIFTGGEDGGIHMFEITSHGCGSVRQLATWGSHTGPVYSLSFEFPWLVSASSDGKLSLIDVRKLLKNIQRSSSMKLIKKHDSSSGNSLDRKNMEPPQRMLHGSGGSLFCVGIGADRIICGGEEGTVRIWNFSQAFEMAKRVSALRALRLENRMRRRKLQNEMDSKGQRVDQCLIAAKSQMSGERNGLWYNKRGLTRKVKG